MSGGHWLDVGSMAPTRWCNEFLPAYQVLGHSLRNAPEFLYREGLERMAAVWQPLTNSPKSCLSVREKVLLIWDASYKNMGENGIN